MDKYSAEIFLNDGEQVFSNTFYTPMEADAISFYCDGTVIADIVKYDISMSQEEQCMNKYDVVALGELLVDCQLMKEV